MKKWLLWTIICILCVTVLLYVGKYFSYTGNKIKLDGSLGTKTTFVWVSSNSTNIQKEVDSSLSL